MAQVLTPDICVIGGGTSGIAAATMAAAFGVTTVLVERGQLGGANLNSGSVPSKALLAAAKYVRDVRNAPNFGIKVSDPDVDHRAVAAYVQSAIETLAPNETPERINALGVDLISGQARFLDRDTVTAAGKEIKARRFIIATGSAPYIPPIPGLDRVSYFTSETVFRHSHRFTHLLILGGGPVAVELAQAYRRLGSDVTLVETGRVLPNDDPELRGYLLKTLREEGIRILENARAERIEIFGSTLRLVFVMLGKSYAIEGSHLLLAMGRTPVVGGLNLDAAGVRFSERGIVAGRGLRTSNNKVYAIGDVIGEHPYVHAGRYHAAIAVKNALFRIPAFVDHGTVPWVTFTDPELAHVGLTEETARQKYGKLTIIRVPYQENDRALIEKKTGGFLKVIASRGGKILGAGIVGPQAGEIIQMWSLAMQKGISLAGMSSIVSPYPTLAEINKSAALSHIGLRTQDPLVRRIIGLLAKLG